MDCEVISLYPGVQAQQWLIVYPSGKIVLHVEFDSYIFLRYGEHPYEVEIKLEEIQKRLPFVAAEVELALQRLRDRGVSSSDCSEER